MGRPPGQFSRALSIIVTLLLTITTLPAHATDEAELLETGAASKAHAAPPAPESIKIVSYNIRWRGGNDLRRLIELLKSDPEIGRAAVIGLQEVDRNKKRTGNVNTARLMAEELGMYYAWAAPPAPPAKNGEVKEEETGVAILSAYPLSDVKRFVLPHEGPGGRRRAAVGATVQIGKQSVRVYSLHAEIRTSNEKRLAQFRAVLEDLDAHHAQIERVIVLGDFNTWTGKDVDATAQMFKAAKFHTPFANGTSTWKTFIIELKLDWLWLRGLRPVQHGIDKKIGLSDHWPLWVEAKL
ncbi:MAG TPA: endonuclease/exonuclease/phosphatase family protein [Pyrinomonadaceae bacterium]|nr:endonuclease/exonuclease/phosphatase family protein [Pyrinomonadaceae bacterium]